MSYKPHYHISRVIKIVVIFATNKTIFNQNLEKGLLIFDIYSTSAN